jgi:hypothetical protein
MRPAAKSLRCLLGLAVLLPPCLSSRVAAQAAATGWEAGVGAGLAVVSSIAVRQDGPDPASLLPYRTTVTGMSLSWHHRDWEIHAGIETLDAALAVQDAALAVLAREASVSRLRWRVLAGRSVARLGEASVRASAGPALDIWSPSGSAARARVAAVARMGLRLDAGAVSLENSVAVSVSGSPLTAGELPDGYRGNVLRALEVGLEARLRF